MAVADINFTTGPSIVPAVGILKYNGCEFSPLFESNVSGVAVKDASNRTIKYMEYTITVDGYVTLPGGVNDINPVMDTLRLLLTAQGAALTYSGRGCDIITTPGPNAFGVKRDVAWGPIPELLEFQPLGGGLSAKVRWRVKTCIPEIRQERRLVGARPGFEFGKQGVGVLGGGGGRFQVGGLAEVLLQFNYETTVTYDEDGYSTLAVRGTLEVPMTRTPSQVTRTISQTADNARIIIEQRVMAGIDLGRFRITKRNFNISRDKRTMEWDFSAEERPYMDIPPDCTIARGTYSFRPARSGMGLATWLCTLRATYTVRADRPRRTAWLAFLALLRLRMLQSVGDIPGVKDNDQAPEPNIAREIRRRAARAGLGALGLLFLKDQAKEAEPKLKPKLENAFLIDLSGDEGVYLDSKTMSFSATWRLVTPFNLILLRSGLWKKLPEADAQGNNLWAISMSDVSGAASWLQNKLDPSLDLIVDFGA